MQKNKTTIVLETEFEVGKKVFHKTDPETVFLVLGYCISSVDENGLVLNYTIGCSNADGQFTYFAPLELEHHTIYEERGR